MVKLSHFAHIRPTGLSAQLHYSISRQGNRLIKKIELETEGGTTKYSDSIGGESSLLVNDRPLRACLVWYLTWRR